MAGASARQKSQVKSGSMKVTAFFTRRSTGSSSSSSSLSSLPSGSSSSFYAKPSALGPHTAKLIAGTRQQRNNSNLAGSDITQPKQSVSSSSQDVSTGISAQSPSKLSPTKKTRTVMEAVEILSPSYKNSNGRVLRPRTRGESQKQFAVASTSATKAPVPTASTNRAVSAKRKKPAFEDDSDAEPLNTVARVLRPPVQTASMSTQAVAIRRSQRLTSGTGQDPLKPKENASNISSPRKPSYKKARLSSPSHATDEVEPLVPSSQSDEQELTDLQVTPKHKHVVHESVATWKKNAPSPGSLACPGTAMVDADMAQQPTASPADSDGPLDGSSPTTSGSQRHTQTMSGSLATSTSLAHSIISESELTSLRSSPVSDDDLDARSKDAQSREQARAKFRAAILSSDEEDAMPSKLRDFGDSSDEDDLYTMPVKKDTQPQRMTAIMNESVSGDGRYNFRSRKGRISDESSGPSNSSHAVSSASQRTASFSTSHITAGMWSGRAPPNLKAKPSRAPFEQLLREKKQKQKIGSDVEALRRAENAIAAGRRSMIHEMDAEDEENTGPDYDPWADEEAAAKAALEGMKIGYKSSSPGSPSGSPISDALLSDREQERLGLTGGETIKRILKGDKESSRKSTGRILGVQIWTGTTFDDAMDVDSEEPDLRIDSCVERLAEAQGSAVIRLFKEALESSNSSKVISIMDCALPSIRDTKYHSLLVPCLAELAFSTSESPLCGSAFRCLIRLMNGCCYSELVLPFALVLSCLVRLGLQRSLLDTMAWNAPSGVHSMTISQDRREEVLSRLISTLTACARAHGLSVEDVPDVIMSLLLVGSDVDASFELRQDVMLGVDAICKAVAPGDDIFPVEPLVSRKAVDWVLQLSPVNKAHVLSFFAAGSTRAQRIGRYIAYHVLRNGSISSEDEYCDLPPLSDIIDILRPVPGSGATFDVQIDSVDYEDLRCFVDILAIALSDIYGYVVEERKFSRRDDSLTESMSPGSSRKIVLEKPPTELEIVHTELQTIYGRIMDTRAAHLDRSRAKAAIQRLSMRIHYQRAAALKSGKPKHIGQYFARKIPKP